LDDDKTKPLPRFERSQLHCILFKLKLDHFHPLFFSDTTSLSKDSKHAKVVSWHKFSSVVGWWNWTPETWTVLGLNTNCGQPLTLR